MRILSVNVSFPREIAFNGKTIETGICKIPQQGPVFLGERSLAGDGQADRENHGHPHQAVYFYPFEHYAAWAKELLRDDLSPGRFGENFTSEDFLETDVCVGDLYRIGTALVRATTFRGPCATLARRMGVRDFVHRFRASLRFGIYAATVETGTVQAGDAITLVERDPRKLNISRLGALYYGAAAEAGELSRILAHPHLPLRVSEALGRKRA